MSHPSRPLVVFAVVVTALLPATVAQAEWFGAPTAGQPAPLYPYAMQPNQPYVRAHHAHSAAKNARKDVSKQAPARSHRKAVVVEQRDPLKRTRRDDKKRHVIEADAEVTILGPDRMIIRLSRKHSRGGEAKVSAQ